MGKRKDECRPASPGRPAKKGAEPPGKARAAPPSMTLLKLWKPLQAPGHGPQQGGGGGADENRAPSPARAAEAASGGDDAAQQPPLKAPSGAASSAPEGASRPSRKAKDDGRALMMAAFVPDKNVPPESAVGGQARQKGGSQTCAATPPPPARPTPPPTTRKEPQVVPKAVPISEPAATREAAGAAAVARDGGEGSDDDVSDGGCDEDEEGDFLPPEEALRKQRRDLKTEARRARRVEEKLREAAATSGNEYEQERERRIAANKEKLAALGLVGSTGLTAGLTRHDAAAKPAGQRSRARRPPGEATARVEPTRGSRRLRGHGPEGAAGGRGAVGASPALPAELADDPPPKKSRPGRQPEDPREHPPVLAPFTLRSIGVTVLQLGAIHRGAFASRYWSNKGCLHHHAYPVGYVARKHHFNREFEMRVAEGAHGPLFFVKDVESGKEWSGESPTKPWTSICLLQRNNGVRISGPLHFGFSDPVTVRAIAGLYSEEELAAHLAGEVAEGQETSAEEWAAKELRGLPGVGEATAIALAHTSALGAKLESVAALRAVARADGGTRLRDFLLHHEDVAEKTRRWPAWRARVVPKLIEALLADDPAAP